MRYILTPDEMRSIEEAAFAKGVPSLLLMETAARQVFEELCDLLPRGGRAVFLCGPGNNGGDGLAAARMWRLSGGEAEIVLPEPPRTPDAQTNLRYCQALDIPMTGMPEDAPDAVVDALFGTGFRGAVDPESETGRIIARANALGCPILAVDIPSGLNGLTGEAAGACVRATRTVALHAAKRGAILRPELTGEVLVADLGLPQGGGAAWADSLTELLPPRAVNAHKGDCGRAALYAGSEGMAGAACMAALACLRAGAGLVTVVCPRAAMPAVQKNVPNAICRAMEDAPSLRCDARLFGCGMAETEESWQMIARLHDESVPEVWDAGALNLLARHPMRLGEKAVLTPHPGEAARLLDTDAAAILSDPFGAASALREKYGCAAAVKSAVTVICAADGRLAVNALTAPALAKGGSGDALAGILTALLAQGTEQLRAIQAGCLWLSRAGRLAGDAYGVRGALTDEVIACMDDALRMESD